MHLFLSTESLGKRDQDTSLRNATKGAECTFGVFVPSQPTIEEVIVTFQYREERIQDIPISSDVPCRS